LARRLLINAQKPEELRIAILDGDRLEAYQVEVGEGGAKRGNIYRGVVSGVQPSLNAAFVDFGEPKNGFLSSGDLVEDAWTRKPKKAGGRPRIEDVLEKGRPILVQVQKDMEGKKGSGLTTDISLAGRYLVFTPFDDKIGISRKVEDEDVRKKLREIAAGLDIPAGGGVIIRTNALEQTKTTISRDFKALLRLWKKLLADFKAGKGPALLHNDQEIVVRALRDFVDANISEILVDTDEAWEIATEYMQVSMPRSKTKLVRYSDREPLFSRFRIDSQIEAIYDRRVTLRSGGSIVIDRTEALTAVDVNSGRSTKAGSQEETAHHTNLEAAQEIARQLRLRDIGGLIVVDFIDMKSSKHRTTVEKELKEAMKVDRARHTVGRLSANGLLEVNRQRIRKELSLQTHRPCPTCEGTGRIASVEMVGLNLLRRIEARATTANLESVRIELHPELADAVQNGRRRQISDLEREFGITIEIIASNRLHRPEQVIDWVTSSEPMAEPARPAKVETRAAKVETPAAEAAPAEAGEGKRRRRRKKKKSAGDGGAPVEVEPVDVGTEPAEPVLAESETPAAPPAEAEAPRRSRRRRRKKKSAESSPEDVTAAAPAEASSPEPAGPAPIEDSPWVVADEAAPASARKRRPRRRARKKAGTDSGGGDAGVSSPSDES
jgi:ribonuclease E